MVGGGKLTTPLQSHKSSESYSTRPANSGSYAIDSVEIFWTLWTTIHNHTQIDGLSRATGAAINPDQAKIDLERHLGLCAPLDVLVVRVRLADKLEHDVAIAVELRSGAVATNNPSTEAPT